MASFSVSDNKSPVFHMLKLQMFQFNAWHINVKRYCYSTCILKHMKNFQFQNMCNTIRNLPSSRIDELAIAVDIVTDLPEVDCFVDDMASFYAVSIKNNKCH